MARPSGSSRTTSAVMPGPSPRAGRAPPRSRRRRTPRPGRRERCSRLRGQALRGGAGIGRRGQDKRLDHARHAFLGHRRRDVAGGGQDGPRRGRHRRPVADFGEHLQVVPLVADRQRRPHRHAKAARQPADRAALRHAGGHDLEEPRVADGHVRAAGEPGPGERRELDRQRRFADGQDLGHRVADRTDEVGHELRPGTHERAVVVGVGVVLAEHEPLEVVDVRVQPVGAGPFHDLAGDLGPDGRVHEEAPDAPRALRRHRPDQPALVADERPGQPELAGKPHRARDHPAGHERHLDAASHGRCDGGAGVGADDQVVSDERAVDVERDEADGQDRRRCRCDGHAQMMPDRRHPRLGGPGSFVSPAGSAPRAAARRGRSRRRTASRAVARRRAPRSPRPGPLRSRAGRRRHRPGRSAAARAGGR